MLFSKLAEEKIQQLAESHSTDDEAKRATFLLRNTVNVINQVGTLANKSWTLTQSSIITTNTLMCVWFFSFKTVGDAISDMLLIEAILAIKGMTIHQWDGIYSDLPNRQLKVKVLIYLCCQNE